MHRARAGENLIKKIFFPLGESEHDLHTSDTSRIHNIFPHNSCYRSTGRRDIRRDRSTAAAVGYRCRACRAHGTDCPAPCCSSTLADCTRTWCVEQGKMFIKMPKRKSALELTDGLHSRCSSCTLRSCTRHSAGTALKPVHLAAQGSPCTDNRSRCQFPSPPLQCSPPPA
jgi:hypothetical protein